MGQEPSSCRNRWRERPSGRHIASHLRDLRRDGEHAAIISSHITSDLEVADYIGILEAGRVIEHDDRERLSERWRKVSGTVLGPGADPSGLFVALRTEPGAFAGVTNAYSPAWQEQARQRGLRVETVAQLTLDEVLAFATGHGRLGGPTEEVA